MRIEILWLDDDNLPALQVALQDFGCIIDRAYFLSEADRLIQDKTYDIVLLDILLAIEPEDIEIGYTPQLTDYGRKAGLAFYRRHRQRIDRMKAEVLVYSLVGGEDDIKQQFTNEGLTNENVLYKVSESGPSELLKHIERVLKNKSIVKG